MNAKRFYLAASLLLVPTLGWGRSRSDLRSDVRLLTKDTGVSRVRFSNAQINDLLNEAQRIAAARSYCVHHSTTFYLAAGTTYYATKTDFVSVRRLTRDWLELKELTPAALDSKSRGWAESAGQPTYYFVNFSSRNLIGFSPFPGVAADTATIRMDYYALPSNMATDSAEAFGAINELLPYNQILPYYAAAVLSGVEGETAVAQLYFAMFEAGIKTMTERCVDRPNYNPSLVGRP